MNLPFRRLLRALTPVLVFAVAFLTYDHVLTYFWTAPDTYSLILAGRMESLADLGRILSEPLMSRSKVYAMYYRPLSTLTFSLDYAIWGLNPAGYHLTDLLFHSLVAVMVYFAVKVLHPGRSGVALLAGLLYTSHPLLVEIVPGIERRQDLLPMVLMLGTLVAAVRTDHRRDAGSCRYMGVSLYGLTLAAKEIGVILLPLIGLHRYLFTHRAGTVVERLGRTLRSLIDYTLVTALYLAWWFSVAGIQALSHGGIARQFIVRETTAGTLRRLVTWGWARVYLGSLYPLQPWLRWLATLRRNLESLWFRPGSVPIILVSALLLAGLVVLAVRSAPALRERFRRRRGLRRLRVVLVGLAGILLVILTAFPLLGQVGDRVVRAAYHDPGVPIVTAMMEGRDQIALVTYLDRVGGHLVRAGHRAVNLLFVLLLGGAGVSAWVNRADYRRAVSGRRLRWVLWYGTWILLPGVLYTAGLNFAFRLMYPVVIPFSILLAHLVGFFGRAVREALTDPSGGLRSAPFLEAAFRHVEKFLLLAGVLVLTAGLVRFSPWFERYPEWDCAQSVARRYLGELSRVVAQTRPDDRIHLDRVPMNVVGLKDARPRVHSAGIFGVDSLPSWLRLNDLRKDRILRAGESEHVRNRCPSSVEMVPTRTSERTVRVRTDW